MSEIKLHLGLGTVYLEGYVNIDMYIPGYSRKLMLRKMFKNKCVRARRLLGRIVKNLRDALAEHYLSSLKASQKDRFLSLQANLLPIYTRARNLETQDISEFVTSLWQKYNEELKKVFLPRPPFDFLRNKIIRHVMFVDDRGEWLTKEIAFLEKMLRPKKLRELLEEDYVGRPNICNFKYLTSHNSIHHLYHLIYFQHKAGVKLDEYNSVLEWGGGYGNMAKIVKRMNREMTYTIIDLPLLSCVQWLYLSTILGEDKVNIITESKVGTRHGKINLLPLGLLTEQTLKTDVFIATWSLSESSKFAQDYVHSFDYFGAEHLLLAFQESSQCLPHASRIRDLVMKHGAKVEAIDFLPGNYYAFS